MCACRTSTDPALLASELRVVLGQLIRRLRAEHRFPLSHGTVLGRLDREGAAERERPRRGRAGAPAVDGSDGQRPRGRRPRRPPAGPERRPARARDAHRRRAAPRSRPIAATARAGWRWRSRTTSHPRSRPSLRAPPSCCGGSPTTEARPGRAGVSSRPGRRSRAPASAARRPARTARPREWPRRSAAGRAWWRRRATGPPPRRGE